MTKDKVDVTLSAYLPPRAGRTAKTVLQKGFVLDTPKGQLTILDAAIAFRLAGASEVFITIERKD